MLIDDINHNRLLEAKVADLKPYKILIIGNIIVNQIKDILEIPLRENNINAQVTFADYDNFVQASSMASEYHAVIVFWEACNFVKGMHYKCNIWEQKEVDNFIQKVKSEISLTLQNLNSIPLILFNKFNTSLFNHTLSKENTFDHICNELNKYLAEIKSRNVQTVELSKIIATVGISASFNKRMWDSSSMLYTYEFLNTYALKASSYMLSLSGKAKKAIVLDCDNTLWKGIVGEDGPEGIAYNSNMKDGVYFEEIHYLLKELAKNGIVLALNSKNNEDDVKAIFNNNEKILLKWEDFIIKKVNWIDKVSNLKSIAKELNIGIDSLVHIDDSNFEINHIKSELPEVTTIQVPINLKDYAPLLKSHLDLFLNLNKTAEDEKRIEMYKVEKSRQDAQGNFSNVEDYLKSLQLELHINLNDKNSIERIAQMTQKTNQFNLTTPRYSDVEIEKFITEPQYDVFSFGLKDKFGDYGTTGLCIIQYQDNATAYIDTFLMSCRIIGRNAEFAFMNYIVALLKSKQIKTLKAKYIKTFKNAQVENLFDNFGLLNSSNQNETKDYIGELENIKLNDYNYIKIIYER